MRKMLSGFIPAIPLPRFFCIRSVPQVEQGTTRLALVANVQGERKEYGTTIKSKEPRLDDVLSLFPTGIEIDKIPAGWRTLLRTVRFPNDWKLECTPRDGGFTLSFDVYHEGKDLFHREKFVEVSEMQLRELIDVTSWAKEAYAMAKDLQDDPS